MSSPLDVALATAEALRIDGAFFAADQAYRHILASHPGSGLAWRGLGLLAEAAGEVALARQMLELAVRHLPEEQRHLAVYDLLRLIPVNQAGNETTALAFDAANALIAANRHPQAEEGILRQLRRIFPTNESVARALAACLHNLALLNRHDLPAAIAYAEEAYALDPDSPEILSRLANFHAHVGMLEKRRALLDRMIELFDKNAPPPGPPRGLRDLAIAKASAGEIAAALLSDGVVLLRGLLDADVRDRFLRIAEHSSLDRNGAFVSLKETGTITGWLPSVAIDAMAFSFKRPPKAYHSSAWAVRIANIGNSQSYLYYHQDVTPTNAMGINLWAALDPIDGTRPGLEMLVRRQHRAFAVTPGHMCNVMPPYRIPDDAVRGVFPDSDFVAPRMAEGDGMMFLFSTIHRSHLTPDMVNSRRSIELRFI